MHGHAVHAWHNLTSSCSVNDNECVWIFGMLNLVFESHLYACIIFCKLIGYGGPIVNKVEVKYGELTFK